MLNLLATLRRVTTIFAPTTLVIAVLGGAVVISSLIGRVEKLELEIKSLRSDLDHPRARPLASIDPQLQALANAQGRRAQ